MRKEMYCSSFWSNLYNKSDDIIMTTEEIENFNKRNIEKSNIYDVLNEIKTHSKDEIVEMMYNVSSLPNQRKYKLYLHGKELDDKYSNELVENFNISNLKEVVEPQYGVVVHRTIMKSFPTEDRVFKEENGYYIDRFMETGVYPGEPCIIYNKSKDGNWYFAKIYNYVAWIRSKDVAIGERGIIEEFYNSQEFIVVTDNKIHTVFNPLNEALSDLQLDMGVRLPIDSEWDYDTLVHDMHCEGNYVVKYPVRNSEGNLEFDRILIPFNEGVKEGYLPYTVRNILKQAFKFQGERYGWGGEFNGRDCSGFMLDVYRSFGIILPRNADEQFEKCEGRAIVMPEDMQREIRIEILRDVIPGTMTFYDGHVAMYIGEYDNDFYIIHDTLGYNKDINGEIKKFSTKGVVISNLQGVYTTDEQKEHLLAMLGINEIRK